MKKKLSVAMAILLSLLLVLSGCKSNDKNQSQKQTGSNEKLVLTSSAQGFGGEVVVTLTIQDGKLISV